MPGQPPRSDERELLIAYAAQQRDGIRYAPPHRGPRGEAGTSPLLRLSKVETMGGPCGDAP